MTIAEIIYRLNNYLLSTGHYAEVFTGEGRETSDRTAHGSGCGCDIWQGLILGLPGCDEQRTDEISGGQNDRFALTDGTVIIHDAQRDTWYEQ
jgi:hypothetical protein